MHRAALALLLTACGGRAPAPPPSNRDVAPAPAPADAAAPAPAALPAEVAALVERWETCQHWAGEEPYDAERAADIRAGVEASCPGNEETRARLEATYAGRPDVLARLRALE